LLELVAPFFHPRIQFRLPGYRPLVTLRFRYLRSRQRPRRLLHDAV